MSALMDFIAFHLIEFSWKMNLADSLIFACFQTAKYLDFHECLLSSRRISSGKYKTTWDSSKVSHSNFQVSLLESRKSIFPSSARSESTCNRPGMLKEKRVVIKKFRSAPTRVDVYIA
jgi:hypothetical protein